MGTAYYVKLIDGAHWVCGLGSDKPGKLLILRYPEGDCDTRMRSKEQMLRALYDLFQTDDDLRSGDKFNTRFGAFVCEGVEVVRV